MHPRQIFLMKSPVKVAQNLDHAGGKASLSTEIFEYLQIRSEIQCIVYGIPL